jgi:glycosyltransferase involved in cell wall biosynthesis
MVESTRLRIGVDGWRLQGKLTGVGTYLSQVISQWDSEMLPAGAEVTLYTPREIPDIMAILPSTVRCQVVGPNWSMLPWQNLRLSAVAKDDVLFCPSYSAPLLCRVPRVLVMFEATQRLFPNEYGWHARYVAGPVYRMSGRIAAAVITTTAAAKDDIVQGYGVSPDKIRVVPMAPDPIFRPIPEEPERRAIRERLLGDPAPFLLHVGKLTRRRNVPLLMRAFAQFKKRRGGNPYKLVVVGLKTLDLDLMKDAKRLGIDADFIHREYVPRQDLADLYATADAFVLPYTYESLSLTALEAQAAGAPVITTDTPGLREQTGNVAWYVDTVSEEGLLRAFEQLLVDTDGAAVEQIRRRGRQHAASFTWRATARQVLDVLLRAAKV